MEDHQPSLWSSTRLFLRGILHRWYWWTLALLIGPLDVLNRLIRPNLPETWQWSEDLVLPRAIGLLGSVALLVFAALYTYHDLHVRLQGEISRRTKADEKPSLTTITKAARDEARVLWSREPFNTPEWHAQWRRDYDDWRERTCISIRNTAEFDGIFDLSRPSSTVGHKERLAVLDENVAELERLESQHTDNPRIHSAKAQLDEVVERGEDMRDNRSADGAWFNSWHNQVTKVMKELLGEREGSRYHIEIEDETKGMDLPERFNTAVAHLREVKDRLVEDKLRGTFLHR